ncbi:MAG: helix-turn-helix domain-containing protein [Hyphomonadaceae bacterium]|nr:helix-turn-helix domain-containing protein [Hyphomonadaceae bacterium]
MSDERQNAHTPFPPAAESQPENGGTARTDLPSQPHAFASETPEPAPAPLTAAEFYAKLRAETSDLRIGQALRQVREHMGLSLEAVSQEIRISKPYLMGIERMETSTLPSGYLTPFLRAYAKRLGLDGDQLVSEYTGDCGAVATVTKSAPIAPIEPRVARQMNWRMPALAAVALMGCGLAGSLVLPLMNSDRETSPQIQAGEPLNGARESLFADVPLPERLEVESLELILVAVSDGWVEIRGADGTLYRSRVMRAGETYAPRIGAGWTINARNGAAFEWRVGDLVIGTLGPADTAVYAASVDSAAARAAEVATPALAAAGAGQPSR